MAEWYSSLPTRETGRTARMLPVVEPVAGATKLCAPLSFRTSIASPRPSGDTVGQAFLEEPARDLAADEHHDALAFLARLPRLAGSPAHEHVHPLEDHPARL